VHLKGVEPLTFPIFNRDAPSNLSYFVHLSSALEGSRTPNLLIRSQVLYPIELQVPPKMDCKNRISFQSLQ
jgi:hypothetical protein